MADDGIDVAVACRVVNVSRSGYYDWVGRPASAREQENEYLVKLIERRCVEFWHGTGRTGVAAG